MIYFLKGENDERIVSVSFKTFGTVSNSLIVINTTKYVNAFNYIATYI